MKIVFWEPSFRSQSFDLFVERLYLPILATRFASHIGGPISESLYGRENCPKIFSGQLIMKLAFDPASGPANRTENLIKNMPNNRY